MKYISYLLLAFVLILPAPAHAADVLENVGIIPGNIWYSGYPIQGGVDVKVYTAVFNGSVYTVEGVVAFTDNGQAISRAPFLIPPGQVNEVFITWVPAQGSHKVSAAITEIKTLAQGKAAEVAKLETEVTAQGTVIVQAPPPPPPVLPAAVTSKLTAATSTGEAVRAVASSLGALDSFASSSLGTIASSATAMLPRVMSSPLKTTVSGISNFAVNSGAQLTQAKESLRASLAAEKARDNETARASLSQSSALANVAPIRWLKSLYDGITNKLASWVLGDLPSKVTAAAASSGSGIKKPFEYLWFFALSIAAFVLTHLWLFWIVLVLFTLWLLRFLYRVFIRRREYA